MGTYDAPRKRDTRVNDKIALAVSRGVSKWRDYYVARGRAEGRPRIQCGPEKKDTERRYISDYMKNCSICKGLIYPGDWIFWDAETKKSRHASSGSPPRKAAAGSE